MTLHMLKRNVIYILTAFYKLYYFLLGTTTFSEVFKHSKVLTKLEVKFNDSSADVITVICKKRQYLRTRESSLFRYKLFTVYDVFSNTDSVSNEVLKEAYSAQVSFPKLLPSFVEEEAQARASINAYLDMVNERVKIIKKRKT